MKHAFLMAIFLASSGPAAAFDLAEFLATMALGKPVEPAPVDTDVAATSQPDSAPVVPVQKSRPAKGDISVDAVWMIGVFR